MASTSAIPLPLQKAIDQLPGFVASITKSRPGLVRTMRPERQESLVKLLTALILSCSLQHDGAICYINEKWAKPKTIEELAHQAGISFPNAKRCLALLKQLKFITSKQIKRKNRINGKIEVSPGLRFFTPAFWIALGLWDLFKQSMAWAKKHCHRRLFMPFKTIALKAKKDFMTAGEVVKEVFQALTPDQIRVKTWCDKIRANIRQNK